MAKEERIVTLHPKAGKSGVNISRAKYDLMRESIVDALHQKKFLTFLELRSAVEGRLKGRFDGSISWYYTTVKLDLEARGIVERVGSGSPQRLSLGKSTNKDGYPG